MKKFFFTLSLGMGLLFTSGYAWAQHDPGNNTGNPELIQDEFFYQFEGDQPKHWTVVGTPKMLSLRETYNSSTGQAIGIKTGNEYGRLEQIINTGTAYKAGDEFEALLHYFVEDGSAPEGGVRLMMQWLDAQGHEVTSIEEKKLLNNSRLWFSHIKSWGTLRFRTFMPAGAVKFRFAIEVNKNSSVRIDDVSFSHDQRKAPSLTVLPQVTRSHELKVGESKSQYYVVQSHHQTAELPIELSTGIPFSVSPAVLPARQNITELTITCTPTEAGKIPRGRQSSAASIKDTHGGVLNIPLSVFATDPNNPPSLTVSPATIETFNYYQGETQAVVKEIDLDFEHMIDNVHLKIVPSGKGFLLNSPSTITYFEKAYPPRIQKGINDTKIKIGFRGKELGTVDAELVVTSPMFETKRIPLKGIVHSASAQWKETFSQKKSAPAGDNRFAEMDTRGYHWFDRGVWQLSNMAVYDTDEKQIIFYKENASLVYAGTFASGIIYNEDFPDGISSIEVKAGESAATAELAVEVSYDHGGTWHRTLAPKKLASGRKTSFPVNTHQPTVFRLVRTNSGDLDGYLAISEIVVTAADKSARIAHNSLVELADFSLDIARPLLKEGFNTQLHHSPIMLEGWRNLAFAGNRPWVSYIQKANDSKSGKDEEVAKVTLYNATPQDNRELTAFLVSPLLSYSKAKSKELTFRLFRQTAIEADKFFIYIGTVKDAKIAELNEIPYKELAPNSELKDRVWYDYLLNLEEYQLGDIEDFVVIFALQSPVGGNETSTTYLIDDVTWGKDDNPVITADKPIIAFYQLQGGALSLNVTTKNGVEPIRTSLFAVGNTPLVFNVWPTELPSDGGRLDLSINRQKLSDRARDYGALLYLSTRGGKDVSVRLFATPKTLEEIQSLSVHEVGEAEPNAYAYRQGEEIHVVAPGVVSVEAYALSGLQIGQTWGSDALMLRTATANVGPVVLVLRYSDGRRQSLKL